MYQDVLTPKALPEDINLAASVSLLCLEVKTSVQLGETSPSISWPWGSCARRYRQIRVLGTDSAACWRDLAIPQERRTTEDLCRRVLGMSIADETICRCRRRGHSSEGTDFHGRRM